MKHLPALAATACLLIVASLSSCAATAPASSTAGANAGGGAGDAVLNLPLAAARQAGLRALSSIGCDIQVQEATHLQGRRPNKIGLVVGSGGETVHIHLREVSATQTSVNVETKKSLVGIAGQKNWDDEVLAAMRQP